MNEKTTKKTNDDKHRSELFSLTVADMEASPKLSTGDDVDEAAPAGSAGLTERRQEVNDYKTEPYTHYLDRVAGKEGSRRGIYWTCGDHYVGEWHLNLRHGRGTHTYRHGSIYEGQWKHGKRDGQGTFWIKEGTSCFLVRRYRGSWKSNLPWGNGSYYGLGGELYTGLCERGKRHGLGTQTYRDWKSREQVKYHSYYGNWVDGKREGLGQLTMSNGNVFQGEWKNDWKEGKGEYFYAHQQSKYEGWWRDDLAVSGVYSRNAVENQASLPVNVWLPSVADLSRRWMTRAASRPPLARFDAATRRTDPAVATRKFAQHGAVYGSPLNGPLQNPDIPCSQLGN